ncbi:MAG: hypothetical protein ACP6IP_04625 [Candidatus Njordarchaeia archaeon]
MEGSKKRVVVKCPKCGKMLAMDVDIDKLEFHGGIAILNIFHGDPPHSLILYLDADGIVRGLEVADFAVILLGAKAQKPPKDLSLEIKQKIGPEIMSAIYSCMVADIPFYFIVDFAPVALIDFLKNLFSDFPSKIELKVNKICDHFSVVILEKDFYNQVADKLLLGALYDMATGKFLNYPRHTDYMLSYVKKRMRSGYKGQVEIFSEVNRLRLLFKKVLEVFNAQEKVSLKKLIKELKLSNKEIEYFKDLLRLRNIDIDKRLIWNPFMK